MELTDKILEDKSPDALIFEQCIKTMHWIGEREDADVPIMMYEMKLFRKGGFAPSVRGCSNCGNREGPYWFSYSEGGMLCRRCQHLDQAATLLPEAVPKLLYIFLEVGLDRVGNISVKEDNKKVMRHLLDTYYDRYGGFFLKSRKFLNQLDKLR